MSVTPGRRALVALLTPAIIAAAPAVTAPASLQPIAAELGMLTTDRFPAATGNVGAAAALARLGEAKANDRQRLRWDYALALLAEGRQPEALGVLKNMAIDEPDLKLVPAWRLAAARAEVESHRFADALAHLDEPRLQGVAEACAWRLRALASLQAPGPALAQLPCAKPALAARKASEREPFLRDAADMANAIGRPDAALHYLEFASSRSERSRLIRAEALLAKGDAAGAARLLAPLVGSREAPLAARAEALAIEADVRLGKLDPKAALARAERHCYRWRGDRVERRMAVLSWDLALAAGKPRSALAAASTLIRHHPAEPRLPRMLAIITAGFRRWLEPGSGVPLPAVAGLMWDNRDLLPNGAAGDGLVRQLAARLAGEGLHARAADLLDHQLAFRARDLAQGPLSVQIAELRLLAGQPDKAEAVIRATSNTLFPEPFATARVRLEAIALFQLGRIDQALALLEDTPGTADLREELRWRSRDWAALASEPLPGPGALDPVRQVRLLRRAIALAMLGDAAGLRRLGERYARAFAGQPAEQAFVTLTGKGTMGSGELSEALAALPSVSPAGTDADLIDLSTAAIRNRKAPPSRRG